MRLQIPRFVVAVAMVTALAFPLSAQQTIGISMDYMGYSFDEGLGADAAQLLLVPLAVRFPVGANITVDLYSAWAQGKVEQGDTEFTLQGVVDTEVKVSYQMSNWGLLSVGLGLPTGNSTHDAEEAVVSAILATGPARVP